LKAHPVAQRRLGTSSMLPLAGLPGAACHWRWLVAGSRVAYTT